MNHNTLFPVEPEASPIKVVRADGKVLVRLLGVNVLCFDAGDVGARHCAIVGLAETHKVTGREVAQAFGLSEVYVSRLRGRYREHGSSGLVPPPPGPRRASGAATWTQPK
jgi:hypothetical protein